MKKNIKIGIITLYYKSHNYGGLLQSYALVKTLQNLGYKAEQISYDNSLSFSNGQTDKISNTLKEDLLHRVRKRISPWAQKFLQLPIKKSVANRNNKLEQFGNSIPHSEKVYAKSTLHFTNEIYDCFITGSDQVWNFHPFDSAYFLDFAHKDKVCMSYAASISLSSLTKEQEEVFESQLKHFSAVSLRENDVAMIQPLTDLPVKWVLDPTLLLSSSQWDELCSPRIVDGDYAFCYFLGRDAIERKISKEYSHKKRLKLVTMPHLMGSFERYDFGFGDVQVLDASPAEFISLIKHAKVIFTDSFHAAVFSNIYKKNFFVFQRAGFRGMGTRIYSLLELFNNSQRFCDTTEKSSIDYIMGVEKEVFSTRDKSFEIMRNESLDFIAKNLERLSN